jgi:hypothetical protein
MNFSGKNNRFSPGNHLKRPGVFVDMAGIWQSFKPHEKTLAFIFCFFLLGFFGQKGEETAKARKCKFENEFCKLN